MAKAGFFKRNQIQYHWYNQDYPSFDAYIKNLKKGRRSTVKSVGGLVGEGAFGLLVGQRHTIHKWLFQKEWNSDST